MAYIIVITYLEKKKKEKRNDWRIDIYETCHEKTCHMRITKAQISLGILTVWSAHLLFPAQIEYYL